MSVFNSGGETVKLGVCCVRLQESVLLFVKFDVILEAFLLSYVLS